jgi:predicted transcriptional regulator
MSIDPVTDGELSILEVIWEEGAPTSRDIADAIYEKVTDSKMASVQTLLERLESKGCVRRDRRERAHRFEALVSREEFLRHRLEGLADRLSDGAIVPLVATLLRSKKGLSQKNAEQLRQLIDELWPLDFWWHPVARWVVRGRRWCRL